jgi:hypothetical protein
MNAEREREFLGYESYGECPEGYEKLVNIELKVGALYKLYNQQTETYSIIGWYQGEQATHAADGSLRFVEAKFQLGNKITLLDYYDYYCLKDITEEGYQSAPAARRGGRRRPRTRKAMRRRRRRTMKKMKRSSRR